MNEQKKKIPWWVALLQLLPAVIDSVRELVKEAKAKKKLKREAEATVIASEAKQSHNDTTAVINKIASPQETVRNDEETDDKPMD